MAIIRSRRRSTRPSSAIGHVSDEKPTDYNGNERATPSLRDLVRPSLAQFFFWKTRSAQRLRPSRLVQPNTALAIKVLSTA
jgi:hypothetical protein